MSLDAATFKTLLAKLPPSELEQLSRMVELTQAKDSEIKRIRLIAAAREKLIPYAKFTMPDLRNKADPLASRYKPARHHLALGEAFQKIECGEWPRLIITMPPRHGKSELASKRGVSWFLGRDPYRQIIFATYNEDFAGDTGRAVRDIIMSEEHAAVFPECVVAKGSASVGRVMTTRGGSVMFVGRGGSITGRGADLAIIDDPIKGRAEAEQKVTRDQLWAWFHDDVYSRLLDERAAVIIIMTRWHEDDLVGRLTDPSNPHYVESEAKKWRILDLPALARDNDPLGRQPGEALWPERFSAQHLEEIRVRNPRGFASLYQGRPTPEDGDFFRADWLTTYKPGEMPKDLRWFGASDHAVGTKQENDRSCLGCGGVDADGVLWIPADIAWGRFQTDVTVEKMLDQIRKFKPITWWAEGEHIGKSIGPFLRRRMRDEKVWSAIEEERPAKDKATRAQAIRGMLSLGLVRFPGFAPWWEDAKAELLKFPNATHDDFVDWLAHLGRGVDRMFGNARQKPDAPVVTERRTFGWLKKLSAEQSKMGGGVRSKFGGF